MKFRGCISVGVLAGDGPTYGLIARGGMFAAVWGKVGITTGC